MTGLKELPNGWQWIKLGGDDGACQMDRVQIDSNDPDFTNISFLGLEHIPAFGSGNSVEQEEKSDQQGMCFRYDERHVLYGKLRPYLNKVIIPDKPGRCSMELIPLLPNECCDRNYLAWVLRSPFVVARAVSYSTGGRMPRADMADLLNFEIPLPPLSEQKAIASRLSRQMEEIDRMRRASERQLKAAKAMRSAILRSVFESEESSDWEPEKLKKICILITDGSHFTPNYVSDGVPFLSVKDVREKGISFANTRFISTSEHTELIKRCHPKKGDVLYTKVGTTGIAKAIDFDKEFSIFVSLALLRPNPDKVWPEYLEYALNSPIGREQAQNMTQGIGNQNLVLEDLENIELPIAPPDLQLDIVKKLRHRLAEADSHISIAERSLGAINALPGAFLRQVFGLFEPPELDELPDLGDDPEELEDEEE